MKQGAAVPPAPSGHRLGREFESLPLYTPHSALAAQERRQLAQALRTGRPAEAQAESAFLVLGGAKPFDLLHGHPLDSTHTEYTAYFFAPEKGQWMLVASFSRPRTHTWLTHLHSFLENFNPDNGYITRKAWYHNQWVRTASGKWEPITRARFTGDNTARIGYRLDYDGGSGEQGFFLRNCGFFNHPPALNGLYTVPAPTTAPVIELEKLP